MPDEHSRNFFTRNDDYVQVSKALRESILFSAHNLIRDPPFLRIDLITCRNVLIYFKPEVQNRLLRTFHHALRAGGHLFLGRSETTHHQDELFSTVNERARIYLRSDVTGQPLAGEHPGVDFNRPRPGRPAPRARRGLHERVLTALHLHALPGAVVVDENLNLQHIFGDVSEFVTLQPGEPNLNLYQLAIPSLRIEIRSMVMKVQRAPDKPLNHIVQQQARARPIRLVVTALPEENNEPGLFLVAIQYVEKGRRGSQQTGVGVGAEQQQALRAMEDQLAATREHLQTVIEELETSNEELQSLNEELSSANEELQSTNEELETSNEELQSTNEELTTVNEELETKTHELIRLNSDLRNVKDSLQYPLLVLDEFLRVTLYNPPALRLFGFNPASIGESLFAVPSHIEFHDLRARLETVIASGTSFERQYEGETCYMLHADPYIDEDNHRKGVVLTFIDNTEMKRAEARLAQFAQQLEASERFARSTIDALADQVCVIDESGIIVAVNRAWNEFIGDNCGAATSCGLGANYIETCRHAAAGEQSAAEFLNGLLEVMRGERNTFVMEYPCHSPTLQRWFEVRVSPFAAPGARHIVITHENITARKEREHLIALQARALDSSSNGIVIAEARDGEYPLIYVNKAFETMTGYSSEEALGRDCRFLHRDDHGQAGLGRIRTALRAGSDERVLLRNYRKDGVPFWNELAVYPIADATQSPSYFVGIQRDMTAIVASEEALRASRERERLALAFSGLGMFSWDVRGAYLDASDLMLRLLGLTGSSVNLDQDDFRAIIHEHDRPLFDDAVKLCLAGHEALDIEYRVVWPDNSIHWLHTQGDVETSAHGLPQRLLCLSQDITPRKESDDRVRCIAHHDALTGLPNRTLLRDRMQQALNVARRQRTKVAIAFVDLDHFKQINDSLGHHIGDIVLQAVGNRLQVITRDTDTVCRHSGDEYIVLLPNVHDSGEVAHVAEKIVEALSQPYPIANDELVVTPSVGVSLYPDDGDTVDVLIRNADAAMYHAKHSGRKTFQFFMPEMNQKEQNRLTITTELRRALERDELCIHYQPQVAINDGRLVGIEALVRWQHPVRGLVYPNAFIPIAEDYELVMMLGEWVLGHVCAQASAWCRQGLMVAPVAVNFSAVQFRQRNVVGKVEQALRDSGLAPALLEIELTESAIMQSGAEVTDTLNNLRELGIRLAIDDFGTGYSSLQHLRHFPIDKLKIDRSFIADLPGDPNAVAIVRAMITLGRSLHLEIVAEGVETPEQFRFLLDEHCDTLQGHYRAEAMDSVAFTALLREMKG